MGQDTVFGLAAPATVAGRNCAKFGGETPFAGQIEPSSRFVDYRRRGDRFPLPEPRRDPLRFLTYSIFDSAE